MKTNENAVATQNAGKMVEMTKTSTISEWLKKNAKYWNNGVSSSFNEKVISPMWECKEKDLRLWFNKSDGKKMLISADVENPYDKRKKGNLTIGVLILNSDGTIYKNEGFGCNGDYMYIDYANGVYAIDFREIEEYITQSENKQEIAG